MNKNIKTQLIINNIKLNTRLVMPPMATAKADELGHVTQEILDYYREKTQDGYHSIVITEHAFFTPEGKASHKQMSISHDSDIDGLNKLTQVIHDNGAKAIAQINHAGASTAQSITGFETVAPSDIVRNERRVDRILSKEEIKELIEKFGEAVERAIAAGYDGVEIHSAHGYLLNQFYSPLTNFRQDEYGGPIENRIRIHLEIIEEVKKRIEPETLLFLRLGALDYMEEGNQIEDAIFAAKEFEKAGVQVLDISGGMIGYNIPGKSKEEGYFSPVSQELKKHLTIPLILTGGIRSIQTANELIGQGKADLIGVGRSLFKDSNWIKNQFQS